MKIALLGYGKMGMEIERIALKKGHSIVLKTNSKSNLDAQREVLKTADVAIDFSQPNCALSNVRTCLELDVPVISGTTGWNESLEEAKNLCSIRKGAFLYASNFSLGVNLFFELNKKLASLMNGVLEYDVEMQETHHTQKLDAPSGTAITLAEGLVETLDRKKKWKSSIGRSIDPISKDEVLIESFRIDTITGIHSVTYTSDMDKISIYHEAFNRSGFASGAILAAEWIIGKKGIFTMNHVLFP